MVGISFFQKYMLLAYLVFVGQLGEGGNQSSSKLSLILKVRQSLIHC